ncbi:MAG: hypothetical protein HDT39_15960 [Lachnospiraceae bacterium]|nr:hypothetical protein [Lachnospiraceae bacterium]
MVSLMKDRIKNDEEHLCNLNFTKGIVADGESFFIRHLEEILISIKET